MTETATASDTESASLSLTLERAAQRSALRMLLAAVTAYTLVGLAAGLFYREFTKLNGFEEGMHGQLGLAHTHILTLGVIVLLVVMALEKSFALSAGRLFRWFFWIYNAGVVVTAVGLVWHGMLQVIGQESSKMIAGIAGTGHMLLGAGFVLLLLMLRKAVSR